MAKQENGGPTPPPDDKNYEESDILEVFPEDVFSQPKKPAKKPVPETQLGSPEWVEEVDLVADEVDVVEEVKPAPPPVTPADSAIGFEEVHVPDDEVIVVEDVKPTPPPGTPVDSSVPFEEVHDIDLWEDEPSEVEVVEEKPKAEAPPAEAAPPKPKAPPDDVAGADDFVEIIDPASTLTATLPPEDSEAEVDLLLGLTPSPKATPSPKSAPTSKGEVAARDKIAEELESGSDLTGEQKALKEHAPVEAPEVDFASDLDKGSESSEVNLGEAPPAKKTASGELDEAGQEESGPSAFVIKGKPPAEEEPVEVIAAEEEEPTAKAAKGRPERKGFAGLPWAAGILIGLVLGGGGAAGLAYTGLLGSGEKKSPPVQPAGPKITTAQQAQGALARRDYEGALQLVQEADKNSQDELAIRGEARWLKYVKEQQDKKAPLSADDPEVKQAIADLKDANDEVRLGQILLALRPAESGATPNQQKVEAALAETQKQLQVNQKVVAGLEKSLAQSEAAKKNLTAVQALLKVKGDQVAKHVALLLQKRNELDANLVQINKQLKQANVGAPGAEGVQQLAAAKDKLEAERGRLDTAVRQAVKELESGNLLPPGAKAQDLVAGIKAALKKADSPLADSLGKGVSALAGLSEAAARLTQQGAKNTLLQTELTFYRMREPLLKSPDANLDGWIVTLRSGPPPSQNDLKNAKQDADFVLANSGRRDPALKLKAEFVQALVAKQQGGAAQARALLDRVVKEAAELKPAPSWVADARLVQQQFTDANTYYLPAARELVTQSRWKEALAKLDEGLTVIPDNGRMRALRSEVRLRLSGSLKKDEAAKLREEARKEAEAATKDAASAGEAYFTLGRIDEEQGDLAKAESHYRQAIKSSKGEAEAVRRYRAALARVILMRLDVSPADVPAPRERKTSWLSGPAFHTLLIVTALVGGDDNPTEDARLKEAVDLANELLKSEDREHKGTAHLIFGKVYTRQGRRTEGLREYILGLQLLYPGPATRDLTRLVDEHPAFQQPDSLARPNVAAASGHYGRGLELFWERQYGKAEDELKQAVANDGDDARYRYFLGLARYLQGTRAKREAAVFDFEQAARLERQNRPESVAVNSSFERLPFALRQVLARYRQQSPVVSEEEVPGKN
jgi:tetratricopeptide (TPR) repeat protein